jgi:hypothetical protein
MTMKKSLLLAALGTVSMASLQSRPSAGKSVPTTYTPQPEPAQDAETSARKLAKQFVDNNLQELCADLRRVRAGGELGQGKLHALSRKCALYIENNDELRYAERLVEDAAVQACAQAAPTAPTEPAARAGNAGWTAPHTAA